MLANYFSDILNERINSAQMLNTTTNMKIKHKSLQGKNNAGLVRQGKSQLSQSRQALQSHTHTQSSLSPEF